MRQARLPIVWVASLLALLAGSAGAEGPAAAQVAPALLDHHVHILGPGLLRDWKSLGVPFSRPDAAYSSAAALFEGSGAPLQQALLVPMAHLYGNEEFRGALGSSLEQEQASVSAENDFVAREAGRHPGRAVALCSVNFRRPYALAELRRCRTDLRTAGIKLHLASAGADLRDSAQLDALEHIAALAERDGQVLLLHLDPQRRGLRGEDVRRMLERVFSPHPRLELIVAHLGGSGGFGAWTQTVLKTLTEWLERERGQGRPRPGVRVDLSAVLLEQESDGVPPTTPEEAAALAPALRRLGLDRVLFGSDYPVFAPAAYAEVLRRRSGLSPIELEQVLRQATQALGASRSHLGASSPDDRAISDVVP